MPRPRKRPATELSQFLDAALTHRGLTHNEFAKLIGMKQNSLSDLKLKNDTKAPDRETIARWARILELNAGQADYLFDLVQLAHAPQYVQDLVARLRPLKLVRRVAESPLDVRLPD